MSGGNITAAAQTSEGGAVMERQLRRGPCFYPVLIEVAGCLEDETVREVTQRLRKYRNRYTPLLRCMFTMVATTMSEARLFGDPSRLAYGSTEGATMPGTEKVSSASSAMAPLFTSPRYAVSVDKTYPLVRRLHSTGNFATVAGATTTADRVGTSYSVPPATVPSPAPSAESVPSPVEAATSSITLPWVDDGALPLAAPADAAACCARAVQQLEDFMTFHFLPFAMTHNISSSLPLSRGSAEGATAQETSVSASAGSTTASMQSAERTFVLRHYVNEASRTSSFLFADPYHPPCARLDDESGLVLQAALVDPREEQMDAYLADLATLRATLTCVVFTHCYVDGSAGLPALLARFPRLRVVSGLPLAPAGATRTFPLSAYLTLRAIAVPAFSPECLLVEVHAAQTLVGLCAGVLWSTDAAPRWDLLQWTPCPNPAVPSPSNRQISPLDTRSVAQREGREGGSTSRYGGGDRDAALAHTHSVLQTHFFHPYLAPLCGPAENDVSASPSRKCAREDAESAAPEEGDEPGARDASLSAASFASSPSSLLMDKVAALQRVVLLPTHGGYSNVTNQLDLYWGVHLGDLCRMKHARTVIDTLATTPEVFAKYNKRIPRLPHPQLFDANRVLHLRQLLASMDAATRADCVAELPADMQYSLANSYDPYGAVVQHAEPDGPSATTHLAAQPQARTTYVNVVDVRDAKDYHALHLSGAVNVPMSFPGVAYGARRAELWLQCVLVPNQPILVLCAAAAQKEEVRRRLTALAPGCTVAVFTLDELPHCTAGGGHAPALSEGAAQQQQPPSTLPSSAGGLPWHEVHCARPAGMPAEVPVPPQLTWVQHASALARLTSYEHLVAIEPTDTRVVLDVRTPYEFKNGSHQHSVHVELSEMCTLAVEDAVQTTTTALPTATPPPRHGPAMNVDGADPRTTAEGRATPRSVCANIGSCGSDDSLIPWRVGSSARLADVYMEKLHTTALMAGLPVVRQETGLSDVVIYCAGGYRSLIAASLLQRAVETSTNAAWRALHIADVSGGAFQIMTQRPDLWRVKDRSIICIS